ncbi:hypothetical protein P5673_033597 [Acropora cervicornis]|uniref:Uncharacterized protein n=1 Tax=Acropora cervicornis TaxID=6130 RepID=A0AAD9PPT0_ACRCE|nr:hypothetical protein P5673_033597 [Acropora cervicornis]
MHCMNDSTKTFKMAAIGGTVAQEHCGGFSFENCKRKWARNCPLREKLEQRFAGLSSSCCGAGTAADKEYVTQLISSNIQLHFLLDVRYDLIVKEPENTFWRL